mgnify:CR=1 FL=1
MNIKIYKVGSFKYTPFDNFVGGDLNYLESNRVSIVTNVADADIIIAQNYKHIKKCFWRCIQGKKFLIWTNEPRFNDEYVKFKNVFFNLTKCHFMNIYTRDIFVTNISIHCGLINKDLKIIDKNFQLKSKKMIALMSYYGGVNAPKLMKGNENIDLIALRSQIALEGSKDGFIDVFGKGWPDGVSKEDSRDGDWGIRKKHLLADYNFNLCFENTAVYNYMTEKIWDSIENYCLPIYYGKHTNAYELFPENSFIDYSHFKSPIELFSFINNMSVNEYIDRMNKCINVYNSICQQGEKLVIDERKKMLDNIVEKLNFIKKN